MNDTDYQRIYESLMLVNSVLTLINCRTDPEFDRWDGWSTATMAIMAPKKHEGVIFSICNTDIAGLKSYRLTDTVLGNDYNDRVVEYYIRIRPIPPEYKDNIVADFAAIKLKIEDES